jgi:hypothetical protein
MSFKEAFIDELRKVAGSRWKTELPPGSRGRSIAEGYRAAPMERSTYKVPGLGIMPGRLTKPMPRMTEIESGTVGTSRLPA